MLAAREHLASCSSHFKCPGACCRLLEIAKVFHEAIAKQTLAQQASKSQAALQASPCASIWLLVLGAADRGCQSAGCVWVGKLIQNRLVTTCRHSCKLAKAETQPKPLVTAKPFRACSATLARSLFKLWGPAEAAATQEAIVLHST